MAAMICLFYFERNALLLNNNKVYQSMKMVNIEEDLANVASSAQSITDINGSDDDGGDDNHDAIPIVVSNNLEEEQDIIVEKIQNHESNDAINTNNKDNHDDDDDDDVIIIDDEHNHDSKGASKPSIDEVAFFEQMLNCDALLKTTKSSSSSKIINEYFEGRVDLFRKIHFSIRTKSTEYLSPPTKEQLDYLKLSLQSLKSTSLSTIPWRDVHKYASMAGYTLCKKLDFENGRIHSISWIPQRKGDSMIMMRTNIVSGLAGKYQGNHEISFSPIQNLIVEIPHSIFDRTLFQGLFTFEAANARFLIISTSHRCTRSAPSNCTGNFNVPIQTNCRSSDVGFSNADAAHSIHTTFMIAHSQLTELYTNHLVVSLHTSIYPETVASDGTSLPKSSKNSPVEVFANSLGRSMESLGIKHTVMLCNPLQVRDSKIYFTQVSSERQKICGATNVQGRHMNNGYNIELACKMNMTNTGAPLETSSNRFLHIEQPVSYIKKNDMNYVLKSIPYALLASVRSLN